MHFFLGNRKLVKADEESAATGLEGLAAAVDSGMSADSTKKAIKANMFANAGLLMESVNPDICTITGGESSTTLTTSLVVADNFDKFQLYGGSPIDSDGKTVMKSSTVTAGNTGYIGDAYSLANAIEFNTTAKVIRFTFYVLDQSAIRVAVNGVYQSLSAQTIRSISGATTNATQYIDIDITNVIGADGVAKVRLEMDGGTSFRYVSYDDGEIWQPEQDKLKCVAYGDSFVAYGAGLNEDGTMYYPLTNTFAKCIRMLGMIPTLSGVGGTGYINDGGSNYTLADDTRLDDLSLQDFDVVIAPASVNDGGDTYDNLVAAQLYALQGIRTRLPNALIIVTSVLNEEVSTTLGADLISSASLDAFNSFNDDYALYIDASGWITSDNSGVFVDNDGTHPSHAGESLLAERLARAILNS